MTLVQHFAAYSQWRTQLAENLEAFRACLADQELTDAQTDLRLTRLLDKLQEDRLHVAFVAEFSRGKSELINAIFFAGFGNRMLPSTAGRTTMCPTELLYDAERPPAIELLPIETRDTSTSIAEYRRISGAWTVVPLDTGSPDSMQEALRSVSAVQRVTPEIAKALGFTTGSDTPQTIGDDGLVEIPRWRHAVINFPHPLLQQGLVILDTPGLNAIGTEPELTLSLLPEANAVLFILAADAGVSQSDLAIWQEHIALPGRRKRGRLVVLNKIDSMWDELKSPAAVDAEIAGQVDASARTLALPAEQIFPVSAQKALVAKINADVPLLDRSRLPALEHALSNVLIPAKQEIVFENTDAEFADIYMRMRGLLESRLAGLREQLDELGELRGKNKGVVEYMMGKARVEKEDFESGLQRFYAVRSIYAQLTNKLFAHLALDALRTRTSTTRAKMDAATFSKTLSESMRAYFAEAREKLARADAEVVEILTMMEAVYKKFAVEHGLKLGTPTSFSLTRYRTDIDRLEQWCDTHLNSALKLMTQEKTKVTQKFFTEVASQVKRAFQRANRDTEIWLKAIMAPMETQVREHQIQLKRRLESIKRIHQATDTLEERIAELEQVEHELVAQVHALEQAGSAVQTALQGISGRRRQAA